MYLNKAIIIGNLTRDPEVKTLPSGITVTTFGVATNRVWKNKEGQKQEDTQFHNVVAFGKQAEIIGQYLKKGSSALIEGRMQTRSWDAADGTKKYRTEIVADRVQFGPRPSTGSTSSPQAGSGQASGKSAEKQPSSDAIEYPTEEINPDDIPF